jgi:hypothetical protein
MSPVSTSVSRITTIAQVATNTRFVSSGSVAGPHVHCHLPPGLNGVTELANTGGIADGIA